MPRIGQTFASFVSVLLFTTLEALHRVIGEAERIPDGRERVGVHRRQGKPERTQYDRRDDGRRPRAPEGEDAQPL